MTDRRLLLCTDMDRTVIPNGFESEHPDARRRFRTFCRNPGVSLVYVTGRHQALVREAIRYYTLPEPDFVISDVGSKVYQTVNNQWLQNEAWEREIDKDWNGHPRSGIQHMLSGIRELSLQEGSKQNTHKLSYYLSLFTDRERVLASVQEELEKQGVRANLIYSVDEPKHIGLLDVLPRSANKLHAIRFLQAELGFADNELIFAGDSGNDLPVLTSGLPSVLVGNANAEIRHRASTQARESGNSETLFIAASSSLNMNANYSAGILEGIWHFAPAFRELITQTANRV